MWYRQDSRPVYSFALLCRSFDIRRSETGSAVYIDTEGSFMAERVHEVAKATVRHLDLISRTNLDVRRDQDPIPCFTVETVLNFRIHLFRCHETTELLAALDMLPSYVETHRVKLVVIDSIAFHFRQDFKDMALRTTILAKMTNTDDELSDSQVVVVTVNQVTVKPDHLSGGARMLPALGESYAHACTTRVILSWEKNMRTAYLYKSPRLPPGRAKYAVTNGGLRDVRNQKRQARDP